MAARDAAVAPEMAARDAAVAPEMAARDAAVAPEMAACDEVGAETASYDASVREGDRSPSDIVFDGADAETEKRDATSASDIEGLVSKRARVSDEKSSQFSSTSASFNMETVYRMSEKSLRSMDFSWLQMLCKKLGIPTRSRRKADAVADILLYLERRRSAASNA
jgi:hypothetical protein